MGSLADKAHLEIGPDRTSLTATTGSLLGHVLTTIGHAWPHRELLARAELVPPIVFTDLDYCREVERQVLHSLWLKLADTGVVPLGRPAVTWEAVPDFLSNSPGTADSVRDRAESPRYPVMPGDRLPERHMAQCVGSVLALPWTSQEQPGAGIPAPRAALDGSPEPRNDIVR